jgi:hypothetical protein
LSESDFTLRPHAQPFSRPACGPRPTALQRQIAVKTL